MRQIHRYQVLNGLTNRPVKDMSGSDDNTRAVYRAALAEHVFLLRCEGLSWGEIAKRCPRGASNRKSAYILAAKFAYRLNKTLKNVNVVLK